MIEELEIPYFQVFKEFPSVFNWNDVIKEDKEEILKKCIDEKQKYMNAIFILPTI